MKPLRVYLAYYEGVPVERILCRQESDAWIAIQKLEAYGLEREYSHSYGELKKLGWTVRPCAVIPEEDAKTDVRKKK